MHGGLDFDVGIAADEALRRAEVVLGALGYAPARVDGDLRVYVRGSHLGARVGYTPRAWRSEVTLLVAPDDTGAKVSLRVKAEGVDAVAEDYFAREADAVREAVMTDIVRLPLPPMTRRRGTSVRMALASLLIGVPVTLVLYFAVGPVPGVLAGMLAMTLAAVSAMRR